MSREISYIPCRERLFPFRFNAAILSTPSVMWFRHLAERLGIDNTLSFWKNTFIKYDDALLMTILSSGWKKLSDETCSENTMYTIIKKTMSATNLEVSCDQIMEVIGNTPPILQIRLHYSNHTMEKEITAYEALHIKFDGLAHLAETLIEKYGKQGELIVYDIVTEVRLAVSKGETISVADFLDTFTAEELDPNIFTAGTSSNLISKTNREAVVHIRECEWARYFQERHPSVGYLLACSTDEVAYKAYNSSLRMQRTQTLMEGGEMCDFKIFTIENDVIGKRQTEN
jgi:hypothetical protein